LVDRTNFTLGTLLIVLLATSIIVTLDNVRIRVSEDKTTFYVPHEDYSWIFTVSGTEHNRLYDGTRGMNRRKSDISIRNYTVGDFYFIERYTPYIRGPIIIDTYKFNPNLKDIELFPISHTVEIYNASGYFYRYIVDDLSDTGPRRKLTGETVLSFGKNMKVELHPGYRWAWIGSNNLGKGSDSLAAQYDIFSDYEVFNVRLFDPIVNNTFYNANFTADSSSNACFIINDLELSTTQQNLTAYFTFDSGDGLNDTIGSNDGTNSGSAESTTGAEINEGRRDSSSGSDDGISIPKEVIDQSLPHSIAFWIGGYTDQNFNPVSMSGAISLTHRDAGENRETGGWSNVTSGSCTWNPPNGDGCCSGFYVYWFNGSTCRIYRNNVEEFSNTSTIGVAPNDYTFSSTNLIATIDEFMAWQRPITLSEISDLFNSGIMLEADRPFVNSCLYNSSTFTLEGNQTQFVSEYDCTTGTCNVNITVEADLFNNYTSGNTSTLSSNSPVGGTNFNYTIELINPSSLLGLNFTVLDAGSNVVPAVTVIIINSIVREGEDAEWNVTYTDGNGDNGNVSVDFFVDGILVTSADQIDIANGTSFIANLSAANYITGEFVTINVTPNDNHTPVVGVGSLQTSNVTISVLELDHGGRDWHIARNTNLTGIHINITNVFVDADINITVFSS